MALASRLKLQHIRCEFVPEYATELVLGKDFVTLSNQVAVTSEQYRRQFILDGEVDIMCTDSPLPLGIVYRNRKRGCGKNWQRSIIDQFNEFTNINFNLLRQPGVVPHDMTGRMHNELQSIQADIEVRKVLEEYNIPFMDVPVTGPEVIDRIHLELMRIIGDKYGYMVP